MRAAWTIHSTSCDIWQSTVCNNILPGTHVDSIVRLKLCIMAQINSRFPRHTDKAALHPWNLDSDTACCSSAETEISSQALASGPLPVTESWPWPCPRISVTARPDSSGAGPRGRAVTHTQWAHTSTTARFLMEDYRTTTTKSHLTRKPVLNWALNLTFGHRVISIQTGDHEKQTLAWKGKKKKRWVNFSKWDNAPATKHYSTRGASRFIEIPLWPSQKNGVVLMKQKKQKKTGMWHCPKASCLFEDRLQN